MSVDSVDKQKKSWNENILNPFLEKHPERKPEFETESGIPRERLYTDNHIDDQNYQLKLGFPGEFPFTRGIYPTMYRGRFWTMRQYAGFGSAAETNKRFRYLLEQGQTGLSIAFDLPTQIGLDSDDPRSKGEVGRVGVAIDSLQDMETLFKEIPLDEISASMTINSTAAILLAFYIGVGVRNNISMDKLAGTIQNDILKEYVARGTYMLPPKPSMKIVSDLFEFCGNNMPRFNTISISGYHIREAGATAVQEMAFTIANGIEYVSFAKKQGLDINNFAARISFFFNVHNDFIEEISKFRAARRIWARIMKEKFGATDPKAMMLRFHTQTAGCTLTAQQPQNNIIRVALQALAAVLGGTQSLHTNSYDEALGLPTEESVQVALRTQQVIALETGVADTVDPLAGSFAVEQLTGTLEKEALQYLARIEEMGGAIAAIENGFIQNEILESAYKYQKLVENKDKIVVGVNKYVSRDKTNIEITQIDPRIEYLQVKNLVQLKKSRDNKKVRRSLDKLVDSIRKDENLVPAILDAALEYATLGEIAAILKDYYGEYSPGTTFNI